MKLFSLTIFLLLLSNTESFSQITGSGAVNNLSKFITTSTIGPSIISDNGTNVSIGAGYSDAILNVYGNGNNTNGSADVMMLLNNKKYNSSNSSGENKLVFGWSNHWAAGISAFKASINTTGFKIYTENGYNTPLEVLTILPWGPVGIGTLNPQSALHIGGDNFITIGDYTNTSGTKGILFSGFRDIQGNYFGASIEASPAWTCCGGYPNGGFPGIKELDLNFNMSGKSTAMKISYNGNIGIGTTAPLAKLDVSGNAYFRNTLYIGLPDASTTPVQISGYALAVNGTAIFNKAKVKSYGNWPDYVFKPHYKLPSLIELESYLLKNQHLPDVPSANEVAKNGIDLGENQAVFLKKVEELTLYMIELNKKVEALAKENEFLKKKIIGNN